MSKQTGFQTLLLMPPLYCWPLQQSLSVHNGCFQCFAYSLQEEAKGIDITVSEVRIAGCQRKPREVPQCMVILEVDK